VASTRAARLAAAGLALVMLGSGSSVNAFPLPGCAGVDSVSPDRVWANATD
jgi:hypothetical protein